ncbi:hypothetical protein TBLA_0I00670 [Henningerozyma blattae CBS 6284]|uniref:RNA binding protein She2 domain-containing protein n=1 Tax=Henningerozyma blattae (strain ATCC 34711 / CBS 6284 / DSM 70876 / NBRC 10599 / NRRL Y-10934 / UCD 77-7) TaxID=1071380 RepID=I2H8M3_HENB6|nr:hypothetical protein TBLA_0I00670 [Tetrapisispora blattae CBS 6284]CCH62725.1 hypothetical protein TBLA_0I00670 [Tetrapisispora blattae CBS 6284]
MLCSSFSVSSDLPHAFPFQATQFAENLTQATFPRRSYRKKQPWLLGHLRKSCTNSEDATRLMYFSQTVDVFSIFSLNHRFRKKKKIMTPKIIIKRVAKGCQRLPKGVKGIQQKTDFESVTSYLLCTNCRASLKIYIYIYIYLHIHRRIYNCIFFVMTTNSKSYRHTHKMSEIIISTSDLKLMKSQKPSTNLQSSLSDNVRVFVHYIDCYVGFLNKYIGLLRRQQCLRFERSVVIKFVKKMRFVSNSLVEFRTKLDTNQLDESIDSEQLIVLIGSQYLKFIEILDLLTYYLTQPLSNETIIKTLNSNYIIPPECVTVFEDTNNHILKFIQWFLESININDSFLKSEVIQFALKWAREDEVDLEFTKNMFLQEIIQVDDIEEYEELLIDWTNILVEKVSSLRESFESTMVVLTDNIIPIKQKT